MCVRERDDGVEVREYNGNITVDEDICFTCRKEGKVLLEFLDIFRIVFGLWAP